MTHAYKLSDAHVTAMCVAFQHQHCVGLCSPKTYGTSRPCTCECHEGDERTADERFVNWQQLQDRSGPRPQRRIQRTEEERQRLVSIYATPEQAKELPEEF